ncbi:MAG: RNA polymerase factor sigma-54 [Gemmataceae bacterium]|nr:RNA polymerase factor sigma-54 [Gemmataceae bacterium]
MRLETSLSQRLAIETTIGPRMIQSMEILQMPLQALEERIEREMEQNPVLEVIPRGEQELHEGEPAERKSRDPELGVLRMDPVKGEADFQRLDLMSRDYRDFDDESRPSRSRMEELGDRHLDMMANIASRPPNLHDHLQEQLSFLNLPAEQLERVRYLISAVNEQGLLDGSLEELAQAHDPPLNAEDLAGPLAALQGLDPPGVGGRDLKECLLLQVTPDLLHADLVRTLILHHLEDIQHNRMPVICRRTGRDLEEVRGALEGLRTLNPRPGAAFSGTTGAAIKPDVVVDRLDSGEYVVRLAEDATPGLRIDPSYAQMARDRQTDKPTRLRDAIEQRKRTLERVTRAIVDRQKAFLDQGPDFIEPLKMQDVAGMVGVDVSTVSRAVSDKWVQTPRGLFPLKRFFGGGTTTAAGVDIAWENIKRKLLELVGSEDKANPLSDEDLVERMEKDGVPIARRTITKYRKMLNIPSSRERKAWNG